MPGVSSWIMHRERMWEGRGRVSPAPRHTSHPAARAALDDVAIAISFLALLGVLLVGGLLMLSSWLTAGLPASLVATCPRTEDCATLSAARYPTLSGEGNPGSEGSMLIP